MLLVEFRAEGRGFLLYSITAKPTTDSHSTASLETDVNGDEKEILVVGLFNSDSMEDFGASTLRPNVLHIVPFDVCRRNCSNFANSI